MKCSRCGFEIADTKTYCSHCGTILHSFTSYSAQMNYNIQPAPPEYSSEYGIEPQAFSYQKLSSRPKITVLRIIRSVFYFIGIIIAAVGLLGTFNAIFGTSPRFEGLAIFFGLGVLVAGVVIFLRLLYRVPRLRLAYFIWGILGSIVGMVMAFALASALDANGKLTDFSIGCVFLLLGFVLAAISLW